jgi:O-antigen/teichoic acid export membrane protein
MAGALVGQALALAFAAGWLRRVLWGPADDISWGRWLRRAIPLGLGVAAVQFMTNADTVYVKGVFPAEVANYQYIPAAMIGLAMMMVVTPVAAVMFPKIARSAALSSGTRALELALGATVLVTVVAAAACTVASELSLRILFFSKSEYWVASPLVPWFAWCLSPLIVANVLIGNLLARERFAVVPWVVVVALSYGGALWLLKAWLPHLPPMVALRTVLEALGVFGGTLCVIAGVFTWYEWDRGGAAAP